MEKRVKQEAQSILANCNLKIFGKLEDPGDTKKFFGDHVGDGFVYEMGGMTAKTDTISGLFVNKPFYDNMNTGGITLRPRAAYDHLRGQREGEVHMLFAEFIAKVRMFYAAPERVGALRVHKLLPVPATTTLTVSRERMISEVAARLKDPDWTAATAGPAVTERAEIAHLAAIYTSAALAGQAPVEAAMAAIGGLPKVAREKTPVQQLDEEAPLSISSSSPKEAASSQPFAMSWGELPPQEEKQRTAAQSPAEADALPMPSFEDLEIKPLYESQPETKRGFVPQDLDMSVVPAVSAEMAGPDVTKLKLPDDMAAYIEGMAEKLNKGLGSKEKQSD